MRPLAFAVLSGLSLLLSGQSTAAEFPVETWKVVASPDKAGWSSEKLAEARKYAEEIGSDAVMIVDDGVVIAEWGDTSKRFDLYSVRKSLLSALCGIAVDRGTLRLNATLAELNIDDKDPELTADEKRATLADLLTSRSGVYHKAAYEPAANAAARPARGSHAHGEFFYYNNWDFNALGTIYEQQAKSSIFAAFEEQLARPLGMQDFRREDCRYQREKSSVHAAYLFKMSARDLARFGLLYLHEGNWNGVQIVPRRWVDESTQVHVKDATPYRSYGYLWWIYPQSGVREASGNGGQRIFVSPREKLVIVHLAGRKAFVDEGVKAADYAALVARIRQARLDP